MRLSLFLDQLSKIYNFQDAISIANNESLYCGWEGWLQVEIAVAYANHFNKDNLRYLFEREKPYISDQNSKRCDFYVAQKYGQNEVRDSLYVELKCNKPPLSLINGDQQTDALKRFVDDIEKVKKLKYESFVGNIGCMVVLKCNLNLAQKYLREKRVDLTSMHYYKINNNGKNCF